MPKQASTVIYSGFSDDNQDLAELTAPNKHEYARRNGYDIGIDKVPWEEWKVESLARIRSLLNRYERVVAVGSDVLFMNQTVKVEPLSLAKDGSTVIRANTSRMPLTIAREHIGWWPINNDVTIWTASTMTTWLLNRLIDDSKTWLKYPWLWQNHIWNLMQTDPQVANLIQVREAREMNATHQEGLSRWQMGDFIIHFLNYPNPEKVRLAREYLKLVGNGDGTYYPVTKWAKKPTPNGNG